MNIIVSNTEKHPIRQSDFPLDRQDRTAILVFGMHKKRGDNKVFCDHVNAELIAFLNEKKISTVDQSAIEDMELARSAKAQLTEMGLEPILVGVAFNLRCEMNPEDYKALLNGIKNALS